MRCIEPVFFRRESERGARRVREARGRESKGAHGRRGARRASEEHEAPRQGCSHAARRAALPPPRRRQPQAPHATPPPHITASATRHRRQTRPGAPDRSLPPMHALLSSMIKARTHRQQVALARSWVPSPRKRVAMILALLHSGDWCHYYHYALKEPF